MKDIHKSYLKPFFEEMNKEFPNKWCVLHSYETLPNFSISDVDMAFSGEDTAKLESLIINVANKTGWKIYQKLWYDSPKCFYYVLKNEDNIFLAIDFLIDNDGIGKYGFPVSLLTQDCTIYNHIIPIPNNTIAFSYKYVKRIVKKRSLEDDQEYLLEHYKNADIDKINNILTQQFGQEGMKIIKNKLSKQDFLLSTKELETLSNIKWSIFAKKGKKIKRVYNEFFRITNRILYPCGMVIFIPKIPKDSLDYFAESIKKRVNLIFRFVKLNHSNSTGFNLKGLVGSTLVIVPIDNFNSSRAIKTHWLPNSYSSVDIKKEQFNNIDFAVDQYMKHILKSLQIRNQNRMKIDG